jgi:hypothetical protein
MMDPVLLDTSFWDVIWWMVIVFFWTIVLTLFIGVFADIFRRDDISGFGKAAWILLIIFLPILGCLIYLIARPAVTPSDIRMAEQAKRMAGYSPTEEIAKAQQLLQAGTITQAEFDAIKTRALS